MGMRTNSAFLVSVIIHLGAAAAAPEPPVWPEKFSAKMFTNRTGKLALTTLWYDWPRGGNLNVISDQLNSTLYDLEWTNGTSFYFNKQLQTCKLLKFPVGILRPDWLNNATYLGLEEVDAMQCHKWGKADFITYWSSAETGTPVRWRFFDGAQFEVMTFEPGATLADTDWQAPASCFSSHQGCPQGQPMFTRTCIEVK